MNQRNAARPLDAPIARHGASPIDVPTATPGSRDARATSLAYGCVDWFLYAEAQLHETSSADTESIALALTH